MAYCTLFDSNYIDKGIVMINSLLDVSPSSKIYVLCMDEMAYLIINDYYESNNVQPIKKRTFFDYFPKLYDIENKRSRGELCWSCTAILIKYVLFEKNEGLCTYIDSDLRFYHDPTVLIDEMKVCNCSVQVVPHNFIPKTIGQIAEKNNGKNCVQFNTFMAEEKSLMLLNEWIEQCVEKCSAETSGDQMYTSGWDEYSFVYSTNNSGAGMAPWNITRFSSFDKDNMSVFDKYKKMRFNIIFYHFQNITYIDRRTVCVHVKDQALFVDNALVDCLYIQYLKETEAVKKVMLEKYGIEPIINSYPISRKVNFKSILKRYNLRQIVSLIIHRIVCKIKKKYTYIYLDHFFDL